MKRAGPTAPRRAIGVPRFELGTSPTRTERATRLRHTPSKHRLAPVRSGRPAARHRSVTVPGTVKEASRRCHESRTSPASVRGRPVPGTVTRLERSRGTTRSRPRRLPGARRSGGGRSRRSPAAGRAGGGRTRTRRPRGAGCPGRPRGAEQGSGRGRGQGAGRRGRAPCAALTVSVCRAGPERNASAISGGSAGGSEAPHRPKTRVFSAAERATRSRCGAILPPGLEQARDRQAVARTPRARRDSRGAGQDESAHELRPPNRQAQRDRAAERVADDRRPGRPGAPRGYPRRQSGSRRPAAGRNRRGREGPARSAAARAGAAVPARASSQPSRRARARGAAARRLPPRGSEGALPDPRRSAPRTPAAQALRPTPAAIILGDDESLGEAGPLIPAGQPRGEVD